MPRVWDRSLVTVRGGVPAVQADHANSPRGGSGNVVALAQWEGPGVLLGTQSGPAAVRWLAVLLSWIDVCPGPRHRAGQVTIGILRDAC